MGSVDEKLLRAHSQDLTPGRFGNHFNPAPKPDALGRIPATPVQIQRAINGENPFPEINDVFVRSPGYQRKYRRR